jgi:hypothetical protein
MGLIILGVLIFIVWDVIAHRKHYLTLNAVDVVSVTTREKESTNRKFLATTEIDLVRETGMANEPGRMEDHFTENSKLDENSVLYKSKNLDTTN